MLTNLSKIKGPAQGMRKKASAPLSSAAAAKITAEVFIAGMMLSQRMKVQTNCIVV